MKMTRKESLRHAERYVARSVVNDALNCIISGPIRNGCRLKIIESLAKQFRIYHNNDSKE